MKFIKQDLNKKIIIINLRVTNSRLFQMFMTCILSVAVVKRAQDLNFSVGEKFHSFEEIEAN